jgi:hypothetical protein
MFTTFIEVAVQIVGYHTDKSILGYCAFSFIESA